MQAALDPPQAEPARTMRVSEHSSRDDMLILATNRFCDLDTHNRLSLDQYTEAFNLLIGQVSISTRQIIARRLAHSNYTPRSIALYLAMEPIQVAMPVLAHCGTLGQLDLLRIIDRLGVEHARAVASRLDIGPSLVQQLQGLNDQGVLEALEDNDALLGSLKTRAVDALFAKIEEPQEELKEEPGASQSAAESETEQQPQSSFTKTERALLSAAERGNRIEAPPMAMPMENHFDFGDAFEKMATARSHQGMAVLMQKRFSLSLDTAHQVLEDKSGDTLAVLLNAADVPSAQANRIQLLTHPSIGLSSHNALRAVRFYAQLNGDSSRAAVDQWPKAKDPQINYQGQFEDGRDLQRGPRTEVSKPATHESHYLGATG